VVKKWRKTWHYTETHPGFSDVLLGGALLVLTLVSLVAYPLGQPGGGGMPRAVFVLAVAGILPLMLRHRAPLLVLVLISAPIIALVSLGFPPGVLVAGLFIACYTVGAWSTTRQFTSAIVFAAVMLVVLALLWPRYVTSIQLIENLVLLAMAFALGRTARARRKALQEASTMLGVPRGQTLPVEHDLLIGDVRRLR